MGILEYKGCSPDSFGCFGPSEQWFLFNLPLSHYPYMILIAAIMALIVFSAFYLIIKTRKKEKSKKFYTLLYVIAFILVFIIVFIFNYVSYTSRIY